MASEGINGPHVVGQTHNIGQTYTGEVQKVQPVVPAGDVKKEETSQENAAVNNELIDAAVEKMNQAMKQKNHGLSFDYIEELDQLVVVVKDSISGEEIRRVPSEEFLTMTARMNEVLSKDGILDGSFFLIEKEA